jgi:uncharacterized protein
MASGLLGIGGGVFMVPFLYFLMAHSAWSGLGVIPQDQAALAHATSLAVIAPTAISGVLAYRRRGVVSWDGLLPLGIGAGLAALLGAAIAANLPAILLKTAFGAFLLVMAWRLFRGGRKVVARTEESSKITGWVGGLAGGGTVGLLSALLGVGGGVVAIPVLLRWGRVGIEKVAPASLAIITFAALAGTLGYAVSGMAVETLPPGSVGYVHLPLLLAMLPGAIVMAPLGAAWNQRLPVSVLRRIFAILLLVVGARLLWVHLPQLLNGSTGSL